MEDKQLPPAKLVQPQGASDPLSVTDANAPVSNYSFAQKTFPIETLEVHAQDSAPVRNAASLPSAHAMPFSRRRATVVSLAITLFVIVITGISSALILRKRTPPDPASQLNIPTQDVSVNESISSVPPELQGAEESLLVRGDIITRGNLKVASGSFLSVLRTQDLTANQTVNLPNATGTVCLDVNNCNFASQAQVAEQTAVNTQQAAQITQIETQLSQIIIPPAGVTSLNNQNGAVSIQGSLNQVSVTTADGTITLSTPQDLDANANVQFGNLTVGASGSVATNTLQPVSGNLAINAGTNLIIFTAGGRTFVFPGAGPGSQTICTTDTCAGGGGGVNSLNGQTGAVTLQGTTDQITVTTGAGTITLSTPQNINTTSSPTFAGLTLSSPLGVGSGGTGVSATPANGQLLIGNGSGYSLGTLSGTGLTITNGSGTIGLAVNYGSGANQSVAGNTSLVCASGVGPNLTGGGNTITLGAGGTCSGISIVNNPTFSTSVTTPSLILTGAGSNGTLQVANLGQATTFTLPDPGAATDTICLETLGNCAGSGGITSINGQTGPSITIANATGAGNTITIQDASTTQKGIAQFNASNFTASGGVINTIQNIGTSATPQFAGLTLTGNLAIGANNIVGTSLTINGNTGAITSGLINGQTISSAANFTGTVAVSTLGTAGSDTVICRNGSNQLATCNSTFATTGDLGNYVQLQAVTPGTPQTGHINVNGTVIGGSFSGSGAGLTNLNASNISSGTLNDARLSSNVALLNTAANFTAALQQGGNDVCTTAGNCAGLGQVVDSLNGLLGDLTLQGTAGQITVADNGTDTITLSLGANVTLQGNTFNGANQLVQLNASSQLPAVSGALLTNLNGSAITTGTVANARLVNGGALTVTAGNGLSGGGSVALGGSTTLSVAYGSTANTAVQGNTQITVTAGTNLTGGGTLTLGAGGALTVNVADSPTFAGDVTVQGGTVIVGADGQQGLLTLYDGGTGASAFTGTLEVATLGADKTYILPDFTGTSATVCLTTGNCAGTGGGVTSGGGTTNRVAKFTSGQNIEDSSISDTGSLVTVNGNVNLAVQGSNVTVGVGGTRTGSLVLHNSTNTNTVTLQSGVTGASYALTLPTAVGSANQCLKAQNGTGTLFWDDCLGGGGGGGITSINGQTGPSITIANATGAGNTVTIQDASTSQKGIAQFNSTNFTASSGTINTIQNIHTAATPTFAGLTLTGNLNMGANDIQGTNFSVAGATGNVTAGLINGQTISSAANFTGSVTVANGLTLTAGNLAVNGGNITSTGALSITPGGTLTVGATGQQLILQGNASTQLAVTGGGFTTTVGFTGTPAGNVTYNFDRTPAAGTYGICTTAGNCVGLGSSITGSGTTGTLPIFTGSQSIGDSIVTQSGSTVDIAGSLTLDNALGVASGGTGAGSFTSNGVLYGNGTGALQVTAAPTAGQVLLGNGSGIPTFTSLSGDVTVNGSGVTAISPNSVALGTDTTGDYVANLGTLTGLSTTGNSGEGSTPTLSVLYGSTANTAVQGNTGLTCPSGTGNLTGGGTSITLGTGGACGALNTVQNPTFTTSVTTPQLILTGAGGNGTLQVANLGQVTAYTLPDPGQASATICLSTGNCSSGVTTIGAIDSQTKSANGAVISGTSLVLQTADASFPGLVSTGTQTFAGGKTFNGAVTLAAAGTALSVTNNASIGGTLAVTGAVTGGTYNGQTISSTASFTGTVAVASLGASSNDTVVCRNGSNQLATCNSTFATTSSLAGYVQLQGSTPGTTQTGHLNISGTGVFGTSIRTPSITSSGTLAVTPGGAMTLGAVGQTATLQGSTTTITSTGGGNDITLTSADQIMLNGTNGTLFQNGAGTTVATMSNVGIMQLIQNGYTPGNIGDALIGVSSTITKNVAGRSFYVVNADPTVNISMVDPGVFSGDVLFRDNSYRVVTTSGATPLADSAGAISFQSSTRMQAAGGGAVTVGSTAFGLNTGLSGLNTDMFLSTADGSTLNLLYGYGARLSASSIGTGVTVGNRYGVKVEDADGAGVVTNQTGLHVDALDKATNNAGIVIGEAAGTKQINLAIGVVPDSTWSNIPPTAYSIYNASTNDNYFAGRLGIGDASPDATFDIDATFTPAATGTTSNTASGVTVSNTVNKTSGTDTTIGQQIAVTRTGASGGTINTTGLDINVTGDGGGTSTVTGLNVNVQGADTNYAAIFMGGNVGVGDSSPVATFTVGSGDLFQVAGASGNVTTSGNLTVQGNTTLGNATSDTTTVNGNMTIAGTTTGADTLTIQATAGTGGEIHGSGDLDFSLSADGTMYIVPNRNDDGTGTNRVIFWDPSTPSQNSIILNASTGDITTVGGLTVAGNITMGDGSSSTGKMLYLDQKDSGDPVGGADGAMYYNTGSGKFRCYEAGAWKNCIFPEAVIMKPTSEDATQNSTTLQDDDHLSFAVESGATYSVELIIPMSVTTVSNLKYEIFMSGVGFVGLGTVSTTGAGTSGATVSNCNMGNGTDCTVTMTANGSVSLVIHGTVSTAGSASTFHFRFAQNTAAADSGNPTVRTGATLKYIKL